MRIGVRRCIAGEGPGLAGADQKNEELEEAVC